MPKRIVWAMVKKEEKKKNVHAKRHERRKKNASQRAWREEKNKKERNKNSTYFQIKGIHPKREIHDSKEYQQNLELGLYEKFHTLARLDQSV